MAHVFLWLLPYLDLLSGSYTVVSGHMGWAWECMKWREQRKKARGFFDVLVGSLHPAAPQMKLSGDWLLIFRGTLTELGPSNMPGKCSPLSCSPSLLQTGFKFSIARERVQLYIEAFLEFPLPASQLPGATCVCHHAQILGGILTRGNRLCCCFKQIAERVYLPLKCIPTTQLLL